MLLRKATITATTNIHSIPKMPSAKFTQTYEKISKMGERLKAEGKSGPSNDEQLEVCAHLISRS